MKSSSWIWSIVVIVLVAVTSYGLFLLTQGASLPEGFVYGNGVLGILPPNIAIRPASHGWRDL